MKKRILFIFTAVLLFLGNACNTSKEMSSEHKYTNALINETSPYLLQHAHNPINWMPWGEEAFEKANTENKLVLISIGYSACHWCHVMERESFEDSIVAAIMNRDYVCIKVDREERPDVDQIYMDAVQLMTQQGGWPLNCFTLPDGRPIYGGTYFPKNSWMKVLEQLTKVHREQPEKVMEYANQLTEGIQQSELIEHKTDSIAFSSETLDNTVNKWRANFDLKDGGPNRTPKFPLPNNYQFLLRQAYFNQDSTLLNYVKLTLNKMARGGIYDQIGGGFARYSTDAEWKIPHFEKMLYDNAQLVSLYAEAYQATKEPLYKEVVYQTLTFIERELTDKTGAFYSALDADSEGEEGKFYIWKKEELKNLLGEDYELAKKYFEVNNKGLWEHQNYILLRAEDEAAIDPIKIKKIKSKLLNERAKRIRPGLDDKTLTSWNALMLKAYADAYRVFGEEKFLDAAKKNTGFILKTQLRKDGGLNHNYKNGVSNINGYLEDYCFTIEALISLYEVTFNEKWLSEAKKLANYTLKHFYDEKSKMFFFTSDEDAALIARKIEVTDNVIPASNSSMAKGLFLLGHYFDEDDFKQKASTMLNNIQEQIPTYGSGYSNWGLLMQWHTQHFFEVAILGKDFVTVRNKIEENYQPNKILLGGTSEGAIPLLENKLVERETIIYVCENKVCQLPTNSTKTAIEQMQK